MKSNLISKSETSTLLKTVSEKWGIEFPKMKNVKVHQILDDAQIITGDGLKILKVDEDYLPFLSETKMLEKFLAVGKSLVSSSELETMEKGEIINNLHYISDRFWETGKTIYD